MQKTRVSRRWGCAGNSASAPSIARKISNSWHDAVSLFVEVETATYQLSDVMKLDRSLGTCQIFFGDIFIFGRGAALLVDATSKTFCNSMAGETHGLSPHSNSWFLDFRFSKLQPRDTIYALLAISKETTPKTLLNDSDTKELTKEEKFALTLALKEGFANKA
jgi:hypothetical protein